MDYIARAWPRLTVECKDANTDINPRYTLPKEPFLFVGATIKTPWSNITLHGDLVGLAMLYNRWPDMRSSKLTLSFTLANKYSPSHRPVRLDFEEN